jgi:hypothetical protein
MPKIHAILTWEYPPRIVGQMAHHVERLATELSKGMVPVSVITFHDSPYAHETVSECLEVHRISNPVEPHVTVVTWSLTLNSEVQRIVSDIYYGKLGDLNLLDVHDWHFVAAAAVLKRALGIPFIFTIHSLEDHRTPDPSSSLSSCIRGLEWLGIFESELVITLSDWMKSEIERIHAAPQFKVRAIPPSSPSWIKETLAAYQKVSGLHPKGR